MEIKVNISYMYNLSEKTIEYFRNKVLENIQDNFEEIDDDKEITIEDISIETIKDFLRRELPEYISESKRDDCVSYSGIHCDGYFNTISFDYYGEDVRELVSKISTQIYNNFKEEK